MPLVCVSRKRKSMDDLLREFLTETAESLDAVDRELVRFEQEPNDARILDNISRLVHTIKGRAGSSACRASPPSPTPLRACSEASEAGDPSPPKQSA
jgi:chemotaxis protein histidine kinase CheA